MAHFAKVIDNIVREVIVADPEVIQSGKFGDPSRWIQTSYNTYLGEHPDNKPLRKNFAGVGYIYSEEFDAFIRPKPHKSWTLNKETFVWEAPVPYPDDPSVPYFWDENSLSWVKTEAL